MSLKCFYNFIRCWDDPAETPEMFYFDITANRKADVFYHLACIHLHDQHAFDFLPEVMDGPDREGEECNRPEQPYFYAFARARSIDF